MIERPILFSGEMVKAILDSRKSMTRRVVKPQPHAGIRRSALCFSGIEDGHGREIKARYAPGDRLWVRETWHCDDPAAAQDIMSRGDGLYYRATESHPEIFPKWRPSIFMPRWASRITLEITDVKVERLQDITERDCHKEGVIEISDERLSDVTVISRFQRLWDSLNKKRGYGWDINPWVWVISFERITP